MTAAQVFSDQQVDGRSVTSDSTQFMSDEVLVAARKWGTELFSTSFTNGTPSGCFGLLSASLDIVRMLRMRFKKAF